MATERERTSFGITAAVLVALIVLLNTMPVGKWQRQENEPVRITVVQTGQQLNEETVCLPGWSEEKGDSALYIASANSDIYHRPECRYIQQIREENRMCYSETVMKNLGMRPCKVCMGG